MAEMNMTPDLRFPEFNEEWAAKKLGNIFEMKSGSFVPAKEIENEPGPNLYPCYGGNGLRGYTKSFTHEGRYNLIGRQGALCGNVNLVSGTFYATEHAVVVANNDNYDIDFVYYILNNLRLNRLATGQAQPGLSISILDSVKFYATKLAEQQKIASFLSAIDERIQLLQKKKAKLEEYKKGVMQQLFSQEIRFKDENGNDFPDWQEKKLGEIGATFNGLTGKTKVDFGEGMPYVQYMQIFSNSKINVQEFGLVKIGENENQSKVQYGDVFFTTSSETPNEIGTASVMLEEVGDVYLNSFCFGFRPNSLIELVPQFSRYLFRSELFRREIIKLAQGSTRFNMSKVELMKLRVLLPQEDEQIKIADFLTSIDDSIESIGVEIDGSIEYKKGLLQKMFV